MEVYDISFDYGFGFTPLDVKPAKRDNSIVEEDCSLHHIAEAIKRLKEEEALWKLNPVEKILTVVVIWCVDEDDCEEYAGLCSHIVSRELYNSDPQYFAINDLEQIYSVMLEKEQERQKLFNRFVTAQTQTKSASDEWSDGSCSSIETYFDNGFVLLEKYDSCPGASRQTQTLRDKEGKTLAYYTYCEDAGNKYGDLELMRKLSRIASNYKKEG